MAKKKKNRTKHVARDRHPERPIGEPDEKPPPSTAHEAQYERPLPPRTPRDFSCLHSTSAHPWRSVRRRQRRVATTETPFIVHRPVHRIIIPKTVPPIPPPGPMPRLSTPETVPPKLADAKNVTERAVQTIPLPQATPVPMSSTPVPPIPRQPSTVDAIVTLLAQTYSSPKAARTGFMSIPDDHRELLIQLHELLFGLRGTGPLFPINEVLIYLEGWKSYWKSKIESRRASKKAGDRSQQG